MIPNTCVGFLGSFWHSFPYDRLFLHAPIRLMFRSILFRVHGFGCLSSNNAIIKKVLSLNSTVSQLPVTDCGENKARRDHGVSFKAIFIHISPQQFPNP